MLLISSHRKVVYVHVEGTGWRRKGHLFDLCESVACVCVPVQVGDWRQMWWPQEPELKIETCSNQKDIQREKDLSVCVCLLKITERQDRPSRAYLILMATVALFQLKHWSPCCPGTIMDTGYIDTGSRAATGQCFRANLVNSLKICFMVWRGFKCSHYVALITIPHARHIWQINDSKANVVFVRANEWCMLVQDSPLGWFQGKCFVVARVFLGDFYLPKS